jgi:pyrroline-5-carboxylate reductase
MKTVGFIGTGNMGEALARGVAARAGDLRILLHDVDSARCEGLAMAIGASAEASVERLAAASDLVVLAVKPPQVLSVLQALAPHFAKQPIVLSVAAGIPIAAMVAAVGGAARIVRAMPNTPCLIGKGISAWAAGPGVGEADIALACGVLEAVGAVVAVDEAQLDAVTALSGSGPAYVFRLIEAMTAGGMALGLSPALAATLARETVAGAAALAAASGEDPAVLRARVTSKGGTTAAALAVFEAGDLEGLVVRAMTAACDRGAEMSRVYAAPERDGGTGG